MADLTDALKEAYATAPDDVILLPTLEWRHSTFKTPEGRPAPLRIVRNYQEIRASLESNAPVDPGGTNIQFLPVGFESQPPARIPGQNIELVIVVDNVLPWIGEYVEAATQLQEPVFVRYRQYRSNALTEPDYIFEMTLAVVTTRQNELRATCTLPDYFNRPFPKRFYNHVTAPFLFNTTSRTPPEGL